MKTTRRDFLKSTASLLAGIGIYSPPTMWPNQTPPAPALISIADLGHTGDGSDASPAIYAALSDFDPTYGGILFFPPGDYGLSSTVFVNKPVTIQCSGIFSTQFTTNFPSGDAFFMDAKGISIRDFRMVSSVPRTGGAGIHWTLNSNQGMMERYLIRNQFIGSKVETGSTFYMVNGSIREGATGAGSCAVDMLGKNDIHIEGLTVDTTGGQPEAGLKVDGTESLQCDRLQIIHAGKALWMREAYSCFFHDSFFDTSDYGVHIDAIRPIVRCHFIGGGVSSHGGRGVHIGGTSIIDDISFSNCQINSNGSDGMLLNGNNIKVNNCSIAGNVGSGIVLGSALKDIFITGNRIGETVGAVGPNFLGIYNMGGYDDVVIDKNNLKSNTWGAWGGVGSIPTGNIT
jgi:hypothetical protein